MSFRGLLNKTCTIQTKTYTQSGFGEATVSWGDTYTNIPTACQRAAAGKVLENKYQVTLKDFVFYFEADQSVEEADRIVLDGETYEVQSAFTDSRNHHKEVYAQIIKLD